MPLKILKEGVARTDTGRDPGDGYPEFRSQTQPKPSYKFTFTTQSKKKRQRSEIDQSSTTPDPGHRMGK